MYIIFCKGGGGEGGGGRGGAIWYLASVTSHFVSGKFAVTAFDDSELVDGLPRYGTNSNYDKVSLYVRRNHEIHPLNQSCQLWLQNYEKLTTTIWKKYITTIIERKKELTILLPLPLPPSPKKIILIKIKIIKWKNPMTLWVLSIVILIRFRNH